MGKVPIWSRHGVISRMILRLIYGKRKGQGMWRLKFFTLWSFMEIELKGVKFLYGLLAVLSFQLRICKLMLFGDTKELVDFIQIDCICKPIYMHMDIHMHVCVCAVKPEEVKQSCSLIMPGGVGYLIVLEGLKCLAIRI